jgi:hypothetical protein
MINTIIAKTCCVCVCMCGLSTIGYHAYKLPIHKIQKSKSRVVKHFPRKKTIKHKYVKPSSTNCNQTVNNIVDNKNVLASISNTPFLATFNVADINEKAFGGNFKGIGYSTSGGFSISGSSTNIVILSSSSSSSSSSSDNTPITSMSSTTSSGGTTHISSGGSSSFGSSGSSGNTYSSTSSGSVSVPEPNELVLFLLGFLGLSYGHRKSKPLTKINT